MEIYIRRNNEEFGPFSREAAMEYVKQGVFQAGDRACYAGVEEWKTVGELLGITVSSRPGRAADLTPNDKITEFNPTWTPMPERPLEPLQPLSRRGSGGLLRAFMIALNSVLIVIAVGVVGIRFVGGREVLERCMTGLSGEFSRFANGIPGMLQGTPAPVIAREPVVAPAPSPMAAPLAGTPPPAPSPVVTAESPAPAAAPVAVASPTAAPASTPAPPPKPFDPADLAGNPRAWPRMLTLKQAVVFPALYNGQIVGSITAPPGTAVNLVKIQGEELVLGFNGGTQTVPWKWTDIEEQAAQRGAASPAAGP